MKETSAKPSESDHRMPKASGWSRVLDLFSNVWLGILWAVLLFIYCSIGSAVPAVRQHPLLEMTEFEWFHWWPFNMLVVLLCVTLIVVTLRRIPFRPVNYGVWAIHAGIITLCIGSYIYFGTKIEGDTPVFRRYVRIELPGMTKPAKLLAVPGSHTTAIAGPDQWHFSVQSTNSDWPILSEPHKGKKAYAVNVLVTPPTGEPFIRQLLGGYPQFTEDVIPGKGRAIKSLGKKLVREELKATLEREPQEYFHVMDTWALYLRRLGETEWIQRPIRGMPRYHDRIGSRDQVFSDPHYPVVLRALDLPVPPSTEGGRVGQWPINVTGYLRYAHMKRRWRDGGDRLNPVVRLSVVSDHAPVQVHELVAFDRRRNESGDGLIQLRWLEDFSQVDSLPTDSGALLHVAVPEAKIDMDVPITSETLVGHDGPFTKIAGTEFSYRILRVEDGLVVPGRSTPVSVAMVEIETPEGRFTRMVADRPEMTRDMHGESPDPHTPASRTPAAADTRITMTYRPRSAPIIYAAYPRGLFLVVNDATGRLLGRDVDVGEVIEIVPGLSVRADMLAIRAVSDVKPFVVPRSSRRRNAGETFAMVRLEVDLGPRVETRWLQFNQYAFPNEQYAYSGRFSYTPERFRLADGSVVEVLFSRERRKLPHPIALEDFTLDTHIGGYSGQALTIRNYVSRLEFLDGGQWTEATPIRVNAPTEYGGYWYFQSMWDKPPNNNPSGGMNYTGLGVGNRNGVYIQLTGCCLSVAGMVFAFYVKPVLKRRRFERSRGKSTGSMGDGAEEIVPTPSIEAVEV